MKYFCFIFFAVGSLGQKYEPTYSDVYNNEPISKTDEIQNYENVPIIAENSFYKGSFDVRLDEKYISLFGKRLGEKDTGKYTYRFDDGNPDIHGRIIRPCQVYDTFCIRMFLAEHSRCMISGRAVPEPLYRAQLTVNYPHVNLSATQRNVQYNGVKDGRIEEFYINKATDNLVIAFYFPSINTISNETALKFYKRGREPTVTSDFGQVNPHPENIMMLAEFFSNLSLDQQEAGLTESIFYALTYIQYNLCDFGLKVL